MMSKIIIRSGESPVAVVAVWSIDKSRNYKIWEWVKWRQFPKIVQGDDEMLVCWCRVININIVISVKLVLIVGGGAEVLLLLINSEGEIVSATLSFTVAKLLLLTSFMSVSSLLLKIFES